MNNLQTHLSRIWFLSQKCKQVPLEHAKNYVRWGHPDGYFLNANGQKMSLRYTPTKPSLKNGKSHSDYPKIDDNKLCHILMALAFYGEREIFKDKNGKPYVGICHHLVPDLLDYKPANLLCWLTREEHSEADRRQRLIKKAVGIEGMREIGYTQLRFYQDPRETSAAEFEAWLNLFKEDQL